MWFDATANEDSLRVRRHVERLQEAHVGRHGPLLIVLAVAAAAFVVWASIFQIDEVARARGEVITGTRVQVIQSVDGGVLNELLVHEGDRVRAGQVLARLDQTRFASSVGEIKARLFALEAKVARLRAEVVGRHELTFPDGLVEQAPEIAQVERALFEQRRTGLSEELQTLDVAVGLGKRELALVQHLYDGGDSSGAELLRAQRALNESEAARVNRR